MAKNIMLDTSTTIDILDLEFARLLNVKAPNLHRLHKVSMADGSGRMVNVKAFLEVGFGHILCEQSCLRPLKDSLLDQSRWIRTTRSLQRAGRNSRV